ncbi:MAG: biopolymer transporter ExbD [Spirochaeta sp.]|jgi:biopolymer transport protein ExbD|nr:biopolymer transporter ExbD [Spirochaeta sp.]
MLFRRRLQPMVNVDLVPMIDVVFQLVIFFMLSSTLITRTGLNLDLPDASSGQETVTSSVVLTVVSPEEVRLGDEVFTFPELSAVLGERRDEYDGRSISIEADASLPYGTMISVLDLLRQNGFRGANLVAEQTPPEESR